MVVGILGINKPSGMSSFDVVRRVKKITGIKKIGHGGTLDPMAEGVLPILINEATSFFDLLLASDKIYEAEILLGIATDTDDKEGIVTQTKDVPNISLEQIIHKLKKFTGSISQVPPQYSALKIDGTRAYALARKGEQPEMKPRIVQVQEWFDVTYSDQKITASIRCGSGTYIRSLARDLAKSLDTVGHLTKLKRRYSGGISIEDTLDLEHLDQWREYLILPEKALSFLPKLEWEGSRDHLLYGRPLSSYFPQIEDGVYTLMFQDRIVALVEQKNRHLAYKKNYSQNILS
ncbi:MAG: tRNA pseudouridine(55) synthase TruB [Brevinema sp.]